MRTCATRPVAWKIHRNKAVADAVKEMGNVYGDFKKGFIIWPMWIGFITHRDNLGFFDGAPGTLRDSFYPHHPEVTIEEVKKARDILFDKGLIIVYQVDGLEYILVPKVSNWSKLIGNISDKTDYPFPPAEVITAWEQRFNEVYTPLIRCSNIVRTEIEIESKSKIEKDIHLKFDEIWSKYPKKVGRKEAERHFKASVKTDKDWQSINKALKNYLNSVRVARNIIQDGKTWFNNWQDWVNYKEDICPECKGKGKFISKTGYEIVCKCPAGLK